MSDQSGYKGLLEETIEQECTRYRRTYEHLRKHVEAEINLRRSLGERGNWSILSENRSAVHLDVARKLEMRLGDVDASA